jgi:hypothetical protein
MANPRMAQTEAHTVLFGFTGVTSGAGQTWEWNDNLWTQRQNMGPSRRTTYNLAYDSQRDRVVLFGGWGVGGV